MICTVSNFQASPGRFLFVNVVNKPKRCCVILMDLSEYQCYMPGLNIELPQEKQTLQI